MAFTLSPDQRARIQSAVQNSWESATEERKTREQLIGIYRGKKSYLKSLLGDAYTPRSRECLVNYFKMYVRGRMTVLAAQAPKWSVNARKVAARGFDMRVEAFLNRYTEVLNLHNVFKNCALDSCFGRTVVKVVTSIAPKGVTSPYAPRAFRINPDNFFVDRSTLSCSLDEAAFMGDVYLVPMEDAKNFDGFNPVERAKLAPYRVSNGQFPLPVGESGNDRDLFVEDMVRLVDVYFPARGMMVTWAANSDKFEEIGSSEPLVVNSMPINPYEAWDSQSLPNSLEEVASINDIKELHFLANDMFHKAAEQGRKSKRNPTATMGAEDDMKELMRAPDNEPVMLENKQDIDLYVIPGPDQGVVGLGQFAGTMLSQVAGNLEVALGLSAGASTARQTQALMNQVNSVQALERRGFETFMANVGKKLASLAFADDLFFLEVTQQVPGTQYFYNIDWMPPNQLPRVGEIDDYFFEVVPYSSGFRTPEERLARLDGASKMLMQWMMAAAQGAPINIDAVITTLEKSFDLEGGELRSWWSGQPPTPAQQTANTYTSTADAPAGSTQTYETNSPAGPMDGGASAGSQPQGGFQNQP